MRVLHSTQYYWPFVGGAEKYCQDISECLSARSKVNVLTTNVIRVNPTEISPANVEKRNGVRILRLESLHAIGAIYGNKGLGQESLSLKMFHYSDTGGTWPASLALRAFSSSVPQHFGEIVKECKDAELVALFNIITGMTSISFVASKAARTPIVVFPMFHFGLVSYERPSLRKIMTRADAVICSTDYERESLIKLGIPVDRAFVVNLGIRSPRLDQDAGERFRSRFQLEEDDFLVSYVGRREFDKGYQQVLSAVAGLAKSNLKVKLVISGPGDSGEYLDDYQYLLRNHLLLDLGIADDVTKLEAISASNVLALPSKAESFGIVYVEAFFLERPVIGADIPSVRSVVRDGVDGFLIRFGDVQGMMKSIKTFYDDRNLCAKMGLAARERAERSFKIENNIAKISEIYEMASKRRGD